MYYSQTARLAVYAEGEFHKGKSKTAEGVIRYAPNPIVAVIDSSQAGKKVSDLIPGVTCDAPLVSSVDEALQYKPDALLLGTAWAGGEMPARWRPDIIKSIQSGMDIINGLHDFLSEDKEIAQQAKTHGRKLLDVRRPPDNLPVGNGLVLSCKGHVVLTVGSDCSVGKMTASLEIQKSAKARGIKAGFVATGQTGIMICGTGIAVDRVIGDFMAGAVEQIVLESAEAGNDLILVEGQGSLVHPGFSGVTLALLHGACPHSMVLCHKATKTKIVETEFDIPPLPKLIPLYEHMAGWMRPAKVAAIAVNTVGLSEEAAATYVQELEQETGLPCCDPVRHGADRLLDGILKEQERLK